MKEFSWCPLPKRESDEIKKLSEQRNKAKQERNFSLASNLQERIESAILEFQLFHALN